jgi:hypothetical protein
MRNADGLVEDCVVSCLRASWAWMNLRTRRNRAGRLVAASPLIIQRCYPGASAEGGAVAATAGVGVGAVGPPGAVGAARAASISTHSRKATAASLSAAALTMGGRVAAAETIAGCTSADAEDAPAAVAVVGVSRRARIASCRGISLVPCQLTVLPPGRGGDTVRCLHISHL